eukprot:TRINITY_DN3909_c0_g2_i3.p1 TRINITY_DN3909_c0_g2~~TRINITY_DN3909_c0_g2_i3.p1  ORF type:complete len:385 (-),score=29.31 TRINITY_DN3909_c0_g2_i3:69-1223(-)
MWFLSIALMFHIQARPFEENMLHNMETLSLSTIVITLNLSLLFEFTVDSALLETLLVIVILMLNLGAVLAILFFMGRELHKMFGDFFRQYGETIKSFLHDIAMSLPLVPMLMDRWKERQNALAAEAAQFDEGTTVVAIGPDDTTTSNESSGNKSTILGRLIHTLEGATTTTSKHSKRANSQDDEEVQAALLFRGKQESAVLPATRSGLDDKTARVRTNRRRASAVAIDSDFREVLADRWIPPRDYEELWADIVDEDSNLLDLLCDEILHFHEVDQQQVYQLEDAYNRKSAELEKELRLQKAKRERRAQMARKSQGILQQKGILRSNSRYGGDDADKPAGMLHRASGQAISRSQSQDINSSRRSSHSNDNNKTFRFTTFFEGMEM